MELAASELSPMSGPKHFRFEPTGLSRLDAMLKKYQKQPKPKSIDELKVALQTIWEELPQEYVNKAVVNFTKYLTTRVTSNGGHFEHLQ